jgi:hypothetical protein
MLDARLGIGDVFLPSAGEGKRVLEEPFPPRPPRVPLGVLGLRARPDPDPGVGDSGDGLAFASVEHVAAQLAGSPVEGPAAL